MATANFEQEVIAVKQRNIMFDSRNLYVHM